MRLGGSGWSVGLLGRGESLNRGCECEKKWR